MQILQFILGCIVALTSAWSVPYYPVRSTPGRILLPPRHQPIHRAPGILIINIQFKILQEFDEIILKLIYKLK